MNLQEAKIWIDQNIHITGCCKETAKKALEMLEEDHLAALAGKDKIISDQAKEIERLKTIIKNNA